MKIREIGNNLEIINLAITKIYWKFDMGEKIKYQPPVLSVEFSYN